MSHDNIPHSDPLRSPVVYYVYQVLTSKLLDLLKLPLAILCLDITGLCGSLVRLVRSFPVELFGVLTGEMLPLVLTTSTSSSNT